MEWNLNRRAKWLSRAKNSVVGVLFVGVLAVVSSGCRSADKTGSGLAETEGVLKQPELPAGLASLGEPDDPPVQRPSYAQNPSDPDAAVRLASNESAATPSHHALAKLVTLRTLGPDDDFQQIVREAPGPVLLDFYADWCGPCRKQGKVLQSLELFAAANQAQIIKVDVEQHQDIAKRFDVASLPTLVVLKNGETVDRKIGLTAESRLRAMLR